MRSPSFDAQRLAPIDGLRAWAVLWVMSFHISLFWPLCESHRVLSAISCYRLVPSALTASRYLLSTVGAGYLTIPEYLRWVTVNGLPAMALNSNGDLGVDVFFVLSGFLIAHMLLKEKERTGAQDFLGFLLRRWLRLAPAYGVCLSKLNT